LADQESEHGSARRRNSANLSGVRKAAILLVAVGEELAKEILRALPEVDVQRLTEELADLKGITPELSGEVLEEFWELLETQGFVMHGGLDYASRPRAILPSCSVLTRSSWASCSMPSIRRPLHWCWRILTRGALRWCWTT
jgi:hypothetical protein